MSKLKISKFIFFFLAITILSLALVTPVFADHIDQPFGTFKIPCDVPDCDLPHLIELAQNVIEFLIVLSAPIAALVFIYAGFLFLTAGGSEGQIQKAKGIFTKVAIGFIIVLSAWLVVYTITNALLKPGYVSNFISEPQQNPNINTN